MRYSDVYLSLYPVTIVRCASIIILTQEMPTFQPEKCSFVAHCGRLRLIFSAEDYLGDAEGVHLGNTQGIWGEGDRISNFGDSAQHFEDVAANRSGFRALNIETK